MLIFDITHAQFKLSYSGPFNKCSYKTVETENLLYRRAETSHVCMDV